MEKIKQAVDDLMQSILDSKKASPGTKKIIKEIQKMDAKTLKHYSALCVQNAGKTEGYILYTFRWKDGSGIKQSKIVKIPIRILPTDDKKIYSFWKKKYSRYGDCLGERGPVIKTRPKGDMYKIATHKGVEYLRKLKDVSDVPPEVKKHKNEALGVDGDAEFDALLEGAGKTGGKK